MYYGFNCAQLGWSSSLVKFFDCGLSFTNLLVVRKLHHAVFNVTIYTSVVVDLLGASHCITLHVIYRVREKSLRIFVNLKFGIAW